MAELHHLSASLVHIIAHELGITRMSDEIAKRLAQDAEYRIREIVQEALKFCLHSKRGNTINGSDIRSAMRVKNVEYVYGVRHRFTFRPATMDNDLFFVEDPIIRIPRQLSTPLSRPLRPVALSCHWLVVDGVQPNIPQNPSSVAQEVIVPSGEEVRMEKLKDVLSKEHRQYFDLVVKTLKDEKSDDDRQKDEVFGSVSNDRGLGPILPYFASFVTELVGSAGADRKRLDIGLRLARSLLINKSLHVDLYLHQMMPAILTIVVGKNHGMEDNVCSIRRDGAALVAHVCQNFGSTYSSLQPRISATYISVLMDQTRPPQCHYGALMGLCALGPLAVYSLLLSGGTDCKAVAYALYLQQNMNVKCYGALRDAIRCYLLSNFCSILSPADSAIFTEVMQFFSSFFGDCLVPAYVHCLGDSGRML